MHHVYVIERMAIVGRFYVGLTTDIGRRLNEHNAGQSIHTAKFKPWKIVVDIAFEGREKAASFERCLKSGSGRAFAEKHF